MKYIISLTLFSLIWISAGIQTSFAQNLILSEQQKIGLAMDFAGKNKVNLQEVLNHYSRNPADSLKLKAAKFLIANMTRHATYSGYVKEGMDILIQQAIEIKKKDKTNNINEKTISLLWDSILNQVNKSSSLPHFVYDNKVIEAKLLIENIAVEECIDALPCCTCVDCFYMGEV